MPEETCTSCGGSGKASGDDSVSCGGCQGGGKVYISESDYEEKYGRGCFSGSTRVRTPTGWRLIKDLDKNDLVVSINKNGELVNRNISERKTYRNRPTVKITVGSTLIVATKVHSIQISSGNWKKIGKLKVGDVVCFVDNSLNFSEHKVESIENGQPIDVYNLIVEGDYNFIVEGCIAHSFTYFRNLKCLYHNLISYIRKTSSQRQIA